MEDIKKIIAVFIKKTPDEITNATLINGSAIQGSILVHRMYAAINSAGYTVNNYSNINTYGDLVLLLTGETAEDKNHVLKIISNENPISKNVSTAIGVDMECVDNLPIAVDIREDRFYKDNFTAEEISYSLLKIKPYETLTGIFCAKEALCKVNNSLIGKPFNQIGIKYDEEGKPFYHDYLISISHANNFAIAVALIANNLNILEAKADTKQDEISVIHQALPVSLKNNKVILFSIGISVLSIMLNLILIYLYLKKT